MWYLSFVEMFEDKPNFAPRKTDGILRREIKNNVNCVAWNIIKKRLKINKAIFEYFLSFDLTELLSPKKGWALLQSGLCLIIRASIQSVHSSRSDKTINNGSGLILQPSYRFPMHHQRKAEESQCSIFAPVRFRMKLVLDRDNWSLITVILLLF